MNTQIEKLIKTGHQIYGCDEWYVFTDEENTVTRECTPNEVALLTALLIVEQELRAA